jgi:hyperosmotically inducible protein
MRVAAALPSKVDLNRNPDEIFVIHPRVGMDAPRLTHDQTGRCAAPAACCSRKEVPMNTRNFRIPTLALASLLGLGASASVMAAAPAPAPDNGTAASSDQPVTDTWITTKVKSTLATTDGVKSMDIDVKTVDGVVTLTGVLDSDIAVKKAVAAAQSIKGVKNVDSSGLKSRG